MGHETKWQGKNVAVLNLLTAVKYAVRIVRIVFEPSI